MIFRHFQKTAAIPWMVNVSHYNPVILRHLYVSLNKTVSVWPTCGTISVRPLRIRTYTALPPPISLYYWVLPCSSKKCPSSLSIFSGSCHRWSTFHLWPAVRSAMKEWWILGSRFRLASFDRRDGATTSITNIFKYQHCRCTEMYRLHFLFILVSNLTENCISGRCLGSDGHPGVQLF